MDKVEIPIREAIKIIVSETNSKLDAFKAESTFFRFDMEASRVFSDHLSALMEIESAPALEEWLKHFRGVSLREWAESL